MELKCFYCTLQAEGVYRVCISHPSTVLAASGLSDTLRPDPGLHILYAHPSGCRLPHCRSPYSHPNWFPGAVKGLAKTNSLSLLNPGFVNLICAQLTGLFLFRSRSLSPDVGAAHVLPVPRLHVRPAVDHLLRAGSCCSIPSEPEPDRVFLQCHPHWSGVLESGYTQYPAAHGP